MIQSQEVRLAADELGLAILPAIQAHLGQARVVLDAASAQVARGVVGDESLFAGIEEQNRASHDMGWCLGVLTTAGGTDVLRGRRNRDGLAPMIQWVARALGDRAVDPGLESLPRLGQAGEGWEAAFLGALHAQRTAARPANTDVRSPPLMWRFESSGTNATLYVRGSDPHLGQEVLALVPQATPVAEGDWFGLRVPTGWFAR